MSDDVLEPTVSYATVYEIPVSVGSVDAVRSFRIIAEMAGWTVTRHEGKRPVHRMAIIMPLQQSVRTFGIVIDNGPLEGAAMQAWSHTPGSAGEITTTEWVLPESINESIWNDFICAWSADLPRIPNRWTFWERSRIGYMLPEYGRSKRRLASWGLNRKWKKNEEIRVNWPPTSVYESE